MLRLGNLAGLVYSNLRQRLRERRTRDLPLTALYRRAWGAEVIRKPARPAIAVVARPTTVATAPARHLRPHLVKRRA